MDFNLSKRPIQCFSLLLFLLLLLIATDSTEASSPSNSDPGPVKPTTPLVTFLERVQQLAFYTFGESNFDPKLYVDLSLKFNLEDAEKAFDKLPRSGNGKVSVKDLRGYIGKYFEAAGDDVVYAEPEDFVPEPEGFLPKVKNQEVRAWALEVHSLWKNLSRRVSSETHKHPELHTLLPLPKQVIIPGSRFREVYYWDSYWIISEPPLLSAMVYEIYKRTGDLEFAKKCLPALIKEHQFWNSEIHKVTIQDAQACTHTLSRYYAMWNEPRPESSTLDEKFASKIPDVEKKHFFREVASTAESGWDFSTRWMRNTTDFTTLATTSILPADLNAFILGMELNIASLAKAIGDYNISKHFLKASQAREKAIRSVFWNADKGQWLDYWLANGTWKEAEKWEARNQNPKVFASNFIPLWIKSFYSDTILVDKVRRSLQSSGLLRSVGIATSLTKSGQQWDFPNGWAPLQHMIVEGLARSGSKQARSLAMDIAVGWIRTNHVAYKKTSAMHEKYNVEKCGDFGGGGEYIPQTGFGWSNGVVLTFLEEFGWPEDLNIDC
ncbi:trehalase isoform X2 [Ziziphus jujuba]|uniref:Trehalase n=1 Tax=Ziziphus jujuba TaxID=326968 RepID=A0ABM4ACV8_ZIZJJ|nr:trehalase isoform X2 [Ziziphus jujuba]